MAFAQTKAPQVKHAQDRRRYQRVRVNLLGRYMLSDRQEYPCQVVNMSPGGMALIAPTIGQMGERVIAYVDHLGRIEGTIARTLVNGFAMTVSATPRKRDKLAAQLTWLANRHILNLPEDRRHGRFTPRNPAAWSVISTKASPSSSPGCSIRIRSKRASRHSKRRVCAIRHAGPCLTARYPAYPEF
jgi:hypothetical protein